MNRPAPLLAALIAVLTVVSLGAAACTDDPATSPSPSNPSPTSTAIEIPGIEVREPTATVPDATTLEPNATVDRIVDGDTLVAIVSGQRERVRLLGIDTPESVAENRPDQCYGAEASSYLQQLLPEGSDITLILDEEARDQYDRLLAYVVRSSDELFVNLDLIEQGYAGVLVYDPNDHYESLFRSAERDAIDAGIGLWGVCGGPDVPLE